MVNNWIAEHVTADRKKKCLTQKHVAHSVGISQQSYARIESGDHEPKLSTLMEISNAIGVDYRTWLPKHKAQKEIGKTIKEGEQDG